MYCPNCGYDMKDYPVCARCGFTKTAPQPQQQIKVVVKKRPYFLIALVVLIVIGLLKIQWDAYISKSQKSTSTTIKNIDDSYSNNIGVGDIVTFGKYYKDDAEKKDPIEWRVLEKDNDKLLLISEFGIDCKQYNDKEETTTWETCTLRKWLNDSFYNAAFNKNEQNQILLSNVSADKNPEYTTNPGNDTKDKVFILSAKEATSYFKNDNERKCIPTKYSESLGATLSSRYEKNGEATCDWWLRTPGLSLNVSCLVFSTGSIYEWGYYVSLDRICVRPVMWIDYNINDTDSSANSYEQKTKGETQTNLGQVENDNLEVFTATIDLTDINLEIESTNKDKVYYNYNGDEKSELKVTQNDNLINISQYEVNESVANGKILKIYVPKKYKLSINGKTASGDINVTFSTIRYLRLNSMSGDLTVISDNLNESSINTMSGDINVVSKSIGTIAAKSMSGDVDVSGEISGTYSASTISGQAVVNGKVIQN